MATAAPAEPVIAPSKRSPRLVGRGAPNSSGPPPLASVGAKRRDSKGPSAQSRPTRPHSTASSRAAVIEPLNPEVRKLLDLQRIILDRIVGELRIDSIPADQLGDEELWQRAEGAIIEHVETMDASGEVPGFIDQDQLIKEALNEALGLGPLEDLLADEDIGEIIVDRRDRILVARNGVLGGAGKAFSSDETLRRVVERLVAPSGHTISEDNPFIDIKLRDGSRLAAAVPPVAVRGACLTLRKPVGVTHSLADLLSTKAISPEIADFLQTCVSARQNILVCGAPSSGKTAVLTALAQAAPHGERVVSIEEVAELSLDRDDWIGLEARPGDGNGISSVSMEQLLRGALRMRPDRLVVADIRGTEALELISTMASSSDGALSSIAGENPASALERLTSMARLSSAGTDASALREIVSCAVDVVVHVARYADGLFRVASIGEVVGSTASGFELRELFGFDGSSQSGGFQAHGVVPEFYADLKARGIEVDASIFG